MGSASLRLPASAALIAGLAAAAVTGTGCTTAIKESVGVARGAKGLYVPVQPVSPDPSARPLGVYRRFEMGPVADDMGGRAPRQLIDDLPAEIAGRLAEAQLPDEPGGKALVIRGRILHYEDAGTLAMVLGPVEEVVARIELVDRDTGAVVGVANCIGRTTERVNRGLNKKTEGLAKAIVAWIAARYPQPAFE